MSTQKAPVVPGIPLQALNAIGDPNVRNVLKAIIDGHQVRNGGGDERFVTARELGMVKGHSVPTVGGVSGSGSPAGSHRQPLSTADIASLLNGLQSSVVTSPAFQQIGQQITLIDKGLSDEAKKRLAEMTKLAEELKALLKELGDKLSDDLDETADEILDDLQNETKARLADYTSLVNKITDNYQSLYERIEQYRAKFDDNVATLIETNKVFATELEAEASRRVLLAARVDESDAALLRESKTRADADSAEATERLSLAATVGENSSHINDLFNVTQDQAQHLTTLTTKSGEHSTSLTKLDQTTKDQATSISALQVWRGQATSSITNLDKVTADTASKFTTLNTTVAGATSQIQTLQETSAGMVTDIKSLTTRTGKAETDISSEATARSNHDNAIVKAVQTIWGALGGNSGLIKDGANIEVNTAGAVAEYFKQVQAAVKDVDGNVISSAAIKQTTTALVDKTGKLETAWVVNVDSGGLARGFRQAGFGIVGSSTQNGPQYAFGVRADEFWIAAPGENGTNGVPSNRVPFIVKTGNWVDRGGVTRGPGVYLNELFATSAEIGFASIDRAHIKTAAVGSLQIQGNAVTVPFVQTFYGVTECNGSAKTVAQGSIYLDQPGVVFAATTGMISYGAGWRTCSTALYINGTCVSYGGGAEAWVNAAHSGGHWCDQGWVNVVLHINGQPGCRIHDPTLFIQGAKR